MKHLVAVLISLLSVVSGAVREYPMGCLDEPRSRLSCGMNLHSHQILGLTDVFKQESAVGLLCRLSIPSKSLINVPESAEMYCSAVHDQDKLGTCTVFAIASAIESLVGGKNISRAELYLRVKTKGNSSLSREGCYLAEYIPLLAEGILPWENFPSFAALEGCLIQRKASKQRLIYSQDYRETIEDFKHYCQKSEIPIPRDFHPRWSEEKYQVKVDDNVPSVVRFLWWFNPIATVARTVFNDHHSALQHYEDRVRLKMEQMPYLRERFNMIELNLSEVGLNSVKAIINHKIPLVISFTIFKKDANMAYNMWSELFLVGKDLIDLPPENAQSLPYAHAVCICGYNNNVSTQSGKGAFRIKNSWGTDWGDKGYAWVSYEYLLRHSNSAYAINFKQ